MTTGLDIVTSRDFKGVPGASRPLEGDASSRPLRGALRSGSPSLRPLSESSGTREDHFPGSVKTTYNPEVQRTDVALALLDLLLEFSNSLLKVPLLLSHMSRIEAETQDAKTRLTEKDKELRRTIEAMKLSA